MVQYRSVVMGNNGSVASAHPLASLAGLKILMKGGNAFDASVATNAVLAVTQPPFCGIGGDIFALIWSNKEENVEFLNGSGRSGKNASIKTFTEIGLTQIPSKGFYPMTIPGCVDGWHTLLEKYGTMELHDLLQDAIYYAEKGFPVSHILSSLIQDDVSLKFSTTSISEYSTTSEIFLPNNKIPMPGEILIQKNLAETLKIIAKEGRDAFYSGCIAEEISNYLEENNAILNQNDFKNHSSNWGDPISTEYQGYTIYDTPPNTQGIIALSMLNILEGYNLKNYGPASADRIHLFTEAKKLAYEERDKYITDPSFTKIPVDKILSKESAILKRNMINMDKVYNYQDSGLFSNQDTTYFAVIDKDKNVASVIQSLFHGFGSGVVLGKTGIIMQNRGSWFSLNPRHVNKIEPNKRTMHTLTAAMIFNDNQPYAVLGSAGGSYQPQLHTILINNIIDYKMNIQEALDFPRFLHGDELGEKTGVLNIENRISKSNIQKLIDKGHNVKVHPEIHPLGHAQGIIIHPDSKSLMGGADPRADGAALAW